MARIGHHAAGQVVLKMKTPWRDGTTNLVMSALEFMQLLDAIVPRPRGTALGCSRDVWRERLLRGDQFRALNVAEGSTR